MTDRARFVPIVGLLAGVILVTAGCATSPAPSHSSSPPAQTTSTADPGPTSAPPEAPSSTPAGVIDLTGLPIACYGLGAADCRRVAEQAADKLTAATRNARIVYLQVGPFGCPDGERCPTTLAARPEGDVIIEFAGVPAAGYHVKIAAAGPLEFTPQELFGIMLDPTTTEAVLSGVQPFTLGHCGLWSGVDLGGSWWDPVGAIDFDHGDAINSAEGTVAFTDPDHAAFTSEGGLVVQLQRRDGPKHFPFCD